MPAAEALPTRPLGERFTDALLVGGDPALPVLAPDGVHPLLGAAARAFADHRPLVLSPDAVWLTILQGVAQHVRLHAEELRPRLVSHAGRKRITVVLDGPIPQDADSWQNVVELFGELLAGEIDDADVFECDFSTSTDVERTAGRIVLLDAYSPYFSLWMTSVCGIPSITLTGTVEDWRRIRARVDAIAGFGLETWCRSLAPIADQFVRAAAGDVDTAFWRRVYNPADAYGGEVITGWIARLYPYLTGDGVADRPNPLLELPIGEPRDVTVDGAVYGGPGIRSDSVPATLSRVRIDLNDRLGGGNRSVALHAGLVGVAQDDDGALRPVAGWYLAPATAEIDDVVDRIIRDHDTTSPQPHFLSDLPADVLAVYRRIGSATLFDGAWRLRPVSELRWVWRGQDHPPIVTIIDLADGRSLGGAVDFATQTVHWVVCRIGKPVTGDDLWLADAPGDVPVYGTSLALLLEAALDTGGDITHLETGRLDRLAASRQDVR
ncbi:hypothetical protein GCM10022214_61000 [Actinomadura miaoliensis]|uniref:DUF4419 domain-containing protein n=1 Tax=Actinomadura miaoliensis TaxID=430685 RepID=A0ABP7WM32_9ACTN